MITPFGGGRHAGSARATLPLFIAAAAIVMSVAQAAAHNVTEGDAGYIQEIWGVNIIPFMYLGAKHMVTGYDHILFLLGVVFFLYKMRDVGIYVSLFALGHSTTMLLGVWFGWGVNAYIVDAIIGLSVVYKALDNLGAYQRWFGFQPNTKAATLIFGFFHGTGLATKILDYDIASDGLLAEVPELLRPSLHRQCRHDDAWFHSHGLSAHRPFRGCLNRQGISICSTQKNPASTNSRARSSLSGRP